MQTIPFCRNDQKQEAKDGSSESFQDLTLRTIFSLYIFKYYLIGHLIIISYITNYFGKLEITNVPMLSGTDQIESKSFRASLISLNTHLAHPLKRLQGLPLGHFQVLQLENKACHCSSQK